MINRLLIFKKQYCLKFWSFHLSKYPTDNKHMQFIIILPKNTFAPKIPQKQNKIQKDYASANLECKLCVQNFSHIGIEMQLIEMCIFMQPYIFIKKHLTYFFCAILALISCYLIKNKRITVSSSP